MCSRHLENWYNKKPATASCQIRLINLTTYEPKSQRDVPPERLYNVYIQTEQIQEKVPSLLLGGSMNENLAVTLGELQAQIYWLHDAEKFPELALAATKIYKKLGYSEKQAETAGKLISEAYQLSDEADEAYQAGNLSREMQFYDEVQNKLTEVETTLGYKIRIARHQMQWWQHFRHKQKPQILLHLFLQHFKAVGLINLVTAIKLTYFLMEIGRVHKQRDLETTKNNARQYWQELLKTKPPQYPYLG